jgi:selenocysteine lyase/cysteine desulfurase
MTEASISRRGFIRTFAGGALGGMILYAFPEEARARYIIANDQPVAPDDETFWNVVRTQFPLKSDPIYLNNGTMGPSPFVVIDAVTAEMEVVDRSARYGGWDDVRPRLAGFIHSDAGEISLTHNVTEGINVVACGLPLNRGDEVIMTDHEHAGNALPWLARAKRDGILIKTFSPAMTAAESLNRIDALITSRTRAIAVPHITCTTGQVLPARAICTLGHDKGLWVMIDAAHTPGMFPLDVKVMGCDFLATCGHKWMVGPKGTGWLYVRSDMQDVLEPHWIGGGGDAGWDVRKGTVEYRKDAHRYDFGSQNAALLVGLGAAVDFVYHIGMDNINRRGMSLAMQLRQELRSLGDRAEILTPDEEGGHGFVIGFRLKNYPYDKLHKLLLEKHRIVTRMVPENGVNCNRISTHIYNTPAEVQRVADVIKSVA